MVAGTADNGHFPKQKYIPKHSTIFITPAIDRVSDRHKMSFGDRVSKHNKEHVSKDRIVLQPDIRGKERNDIF